MFKWDLSTSSDRNTDESIYGSDLERSNHGTKWQDTKIKLLEANTDRKCQYLSNRAPTPPLTQHWL